DREFADMISYAKHKALVTTAVQAKTKELLPLSDG
ncbi:MAG: hypothetical protein QG617_529, partial [Campylobacterota bacterium]|nr:hypothetical protein [Campylobacterota bacterium]